MGLFNSLKGKGPKYIGGESNDQAGQGGDSDHLASQLMRREEDTTEREKRRLFGHGSEQSNSSRPSGKEEYLPPPGPPPSFSPPSNPPPYHDWTVVPDTSLLPPPPAINHLNSPTNNASYDSAAHARAWCDRNPPYSPAMPSPAVFSTVQRGDLALDRPAGYIGELSAVRSSSSSNSIGATRKWHGRTKPRCNDAILLSNLPLYFAALPLSEQPHPPSSSSSPRTTIYFEVAIISIQNSSSGLALGFCARPYPSWRLPGWHRASVGVHGDDGRRFTNDSWGGVDFVAPFRARDVVGLGMEFRPPQQAPLQTQPESRSSIRPERAATQAQTTCFFTRNGAREAEWLVNEERDAERDEGVEGLAGELDLYAALGVFGAVEFEVRFGAAEWLYHGP